MTRSFSRTLAVIGLCALVATVGSAQRTKALDDYLPDAGVPQITTLEGVFLRAAHNNEGYVVLGYRAANGSVGEPWMLLDVGIALGKGPKNQKITRDEVSLSTPDGKTVQLPSNAEYVSANLNATEYRVRFLHEELAFPAETYGRSCPDKNGSTVQGGRGDARKELQEHQEAGGAGVPGEEVAATQLAARDKRPLPSERTTVRSSVSHQRSPLEPQPGPAPTPTPRPAGGPRWSLFANEEWRRVTV
jgi:hypothetical protein